MSLDLIIVISWLAFWVYWLAAARRSGFANSSAANRGSRVNWLLGSILLFIIINRIWNLGQATFHHRAASVAAGVALFYSGLVFAIWARRHLAENWGLPMTIRQKPKLITTGPYHWVRHPIYTGVIFAALGCALMLSWTWVFIFATSTIYWVFCAVEEEKMLARQLPKEYLAYKRRTKMLIPYIL